MKKKIVIAVIAAVVVLFLIFSVFSYRWFVIKQARVAAGTARPFFPYEDYSIEELNKMYPQTANLDVATTQSPEETHRKFLEALKKGDFDGAVECCFRRGDWDDMIASLAIIKKEGYMAKMIKDLDANIEPNFLGDNKASYNYVIEKDGKKFSSVIGFIKNSQGIWLIESL